MKFNVFNPFPIYDIPAASWPIPAKLARDSAVVNRSMDAAIEFTRRADAGGADMISVAEHHYSNKQLTPNSVLAATIVAQNVENAAVGLLGTTLPLVNPVRAAEEIAMLDTLTKGRLLVGFFRGTPNEFLPYGTNPWESKEVFHEQLELVRACWTEPEPFAWIGRHFEYKTISVWPQPVQERIPTLLTANSPASAQYASQNGYMAGFSFYPAEMLAPLARHFVEQARAVGRTVTPEDLLYRSFVLVADTDEEAERIFEETRFGDMIKFTKDLGASPMLMGRLASAMAGVPASVPLTGNKGGPAMPTRPGFIGSPDTVARQIREFVAATGIGRIEATINEATLPQKYSDRSLDLYLQEVVPQLRKLDVVELTKESGSNIFAVPEEELVSQ